MMVIIILFSILMAAASFAFTIMGIMGINMIKEDTEERKKRNGKDE